MAGSWLDLYEGGEGGDNVYINCSILGVMMSRDLDCGKLKIALSNSRNSKLCFICLYF